MDALHVEVSSKKGRGSILAPPYCFWPGDALPRLIVIYKRSFRIRDKDCRAACVQRSRAHIEARLGQVSNGDHKTAAPLGSPTDTGKGALIGCGGLRPLGQDGSSWYEGRGGCCTAHFNHPVQATSSYHLALKMARIPICYREGHPG